MQKKFIRYIAQSIPLLLVSNLTWALEIIDLNNANLADLPELKHELQGDFSKNSSLLNENKPSFKLIKKYTDKNGNTHIRYQQLIQGIPVFGKNIIVHVKNDNANKLLLPMDNKLSGQIVKDTDKDLSLVQSHKYNPQAELIRVKKGYIKKFGLSEDNAKFTNQEARLVYYIDKENKARLAYEISFFVDLETGGYPSRPFYLIDANNLEVIKEWNGLAHKHVGIGPGGNEKIGYYEYGQDFGELDVTEDESSANCKMLSNNVKTVDLKQSVNRFFKEAHSYPCYRQEGDAINGAFSAINDAHFFGSVVFDMYKDWYKTAPLTFQLVMKVHYGVEYENAFWDGRSMSFGDGAEKFYPLVSLDVVAHEISHGFTEQHSDLIYQGQSGGINEAFSDMAGKAAEFYMRGSNTWEIGSDITKSNIALRYMVDPTKDGRSIGHVRDFREYMNVHYSSGVFNKAFYLLATTEGWDTRKAFDVMVAANASYWQPDSDFKDAAWGVVQAAYNLNYPVSDVINSFSKVGINCTSSACNIMEG